jgi:hypothetical protein
MKSKLERSIRILVAGHTADGIVTGLGIYLEAGTVIEKNYLIRWAANRVADHHMNVVGTDPWMMAGISVASWKIAIVCAVASILLLTRRADSLPFAPAWITVLGLVGFLAAVTNLGVLFG